MALINRETLKNYFKKGGFATEKHFVDLIDSSLNVVDDGIAIKPEYGLKINPLGFSSKLISFFKKSTQKTPDYSVTINHNGVEGLSFQSKEDDTLLKFKNNNKIGVLTNDPSHDFEVNGVFACSEKAGSYLSGKAPGDRTWYTILSNLDGLNAFEINAYIRGKVGSGRYAIAHTIALSTFGGRGSRSKIKSTVAHYGSFLIKIEFRFTGEMHDYELQVRTRRHYGIDSNTGEPYQIHFNLTKIFTD